MFIKYIYSIFIGFLITLVIGLGIAAFYEAPEYPEYASTPKISGELTEDEIRENENLMNIEYDKYNTEENTYNRKVSIILICSSVVILGIGLLLAKINSIFADGMLFGSIFTLIYSIIRGFGSENQKFSFFVVVIALCIALGIGYLIFNKSMFIIGEGKK